jgi:hypothetical protein
VRTYWRDLHKTKGSPLCNHSLQQANSWWLRWVKRWSWVQHQQLLCGHSLILAKPPPAHMGTSKGQERRERSSSKPIIMIPKLIHYGFHHSLSRSAETNCCFKTSLQRPWGTEDPKNPVCSLCEKGGDPALESLLYLELALCRPASSCSMTAMRSIVGMLR